MGAGNKTIRVLSLDGGGVRGLSSMIILDHLLELINERLRQSPVGKHVENVLPAEIFDHIVGTSTGGLIAVMLVKLNMPIKECIQVYKNLCPRIFGKRQFGSCIGGLGVPRYSDENFRKCLQEVFHKYGKRSSGNTIRFMEEGSIGGNKAYCTVVCRELTSSGRRMGHPAFICSHYCRSTQKETGRYIPYELWMTCRATTAAPTFFSRMTMHGRTFVDGAFGHTNNPTRKAHFHFLSKVSGYKDHPVVWMNIGTGSPKPSETSTIGSRRFSTVRRSWKERLMPNAIRDARNLLRDLEAIATDSDRVEEEMEDIISSRSNNQHIIFARVSANNGVAEVQLDDWRGMPMIEELTRMYLQRSEVQAKLEKMADELAEETIRRRKSVSASKAAGEPLPLKPPFLNNHHDDVGPLPSPETTIPQPDRESHHNPHSTVPVTPITPISPVTADDRDEEYNTEVDDPPKAPEISPVSSMSNESRVHRSSRSTQDLFAKVSGLLGVSGSSTRNGRGFTNLEFEGSTEKMGEKWKRRATIF